jgi:polyhydroxybutyrate depolymerase
MVAYPQGENRQWGIAIDSDSGHFGRDRVLLESLVDAAVSGGCADADRVIVTGFSLGGIFAHGLACADAERFHALVEVSSREVSPYVSSGPQVLEPCSPSRSVTVIAYNSVKDDVIPYAGGHAFGLWFPSAGDWIAGWARRNGCAAAPATTISNDRLDRLEWTGCRAPTVLYRIKGGSHVWFGGDPPIGGLAVDDVDPTETIERLAQGEAP